MVCTENNFNKNVFNLNLHINTIGNAFFRVIHCRKQQVLFFLILRNHGAGDKLISELNAKEFTYYPSKYISVENAIELCKQSLDTTLFFSHVTNPAHTNLADLKFRHKLGGFELNIYESVIYLFSLTFLKHGFNAKILTEFSQVVTIGIRKQKDYETLTRAFRMEYYNNSSAVESVADLGKVYDLKSPEIWKFMDALATNVS